MSDSMASLRRKIDSAGDLQSVVRTMKAVAASSVGQYEKSMLALVNYYRTVELGLAACLHRSETTPFVAAEKRKTEIGAIVFGSDQGLVGQFNDVVADYAIETLASLPGKPQVWVIGERVHERLVEAGLSVIAVFASPNTVQAITPLVGQIQMASEAHRENTDNGCVYIFHNRPRSGSLYEPTGQRLLPLDARWQSDLAKIPWPSENLPEILGDSDETLRKLIHEYLFISLFRACAESLASENASRLSAMQRAERNIDELLDDLHGAFHRLRQGSIDDELFDVVSGFEALSSP
ncbi:F0F1 ATP synthase subunit gamma [Capsulimonas corticalis]|uniref:F0F1 ATP synthase subunit gamma n=1 Tax=Capsulimonas corticalis TaxID=2219043 RepID=A0A402CY24_9BACT|nr:F0F1 ATP synthase subunit gamma [Capsulimonas corticalis]BDI32104.1 F0F1 ATP synthase subunit gamma [Capsulimonas corticalis]